MTRRSPYTTRTVGAVGVEVWQRVALHTGPNAQADADAHVARLVGEDSGVDS